MKGVLALSAFAGALVLGCSNSGDDEGLDRLGQPVRGGTEAPDDRAVVGVVNFAGGQCSGSLIAPRLVLSARHCVADTAGQEVKVICGQTKFNPPDSAGAVFVVPLPVISEDPEDYLAVSQILLPEDAGDDLCGSDEILLVLAEPLSDITPLEPRLDAPVVAGERYASVGYGIDDALLDKPSGVRKRLGELEVTCSGADCGDSDVRDNEWVGSGGPCSGDSGGPALDDDGRVVGVVSRGKEHCTEPVFGDVSSRASWLVQRAIQVASAAGEARPSWAPCSEQYPCRDSADDEGLNSSCSLGARRTGQPSVASALLLLGLYLVRARLDRPRNSRASRA